MKVKKIRKTKLFTYALALMMVLIPLIAFSLTPVAYADTYPSPPALVTLTATGPTTATVSWTSSSGASYYYVGYSTTSTFTNVWNGGYTTAPTTSKNLTGLSPGTTYYAFVAALNSSWGYEGYTTNTYTVAYNGNGATGTPPADTGTYIAGATVTLPATQTSVADLVYSGYTFFRRHPGQSEPQHGYPQSDLYTRYAHLHGKRVKRCDQRHGDSVSELGLRSGIHERQLRDKPDNAPQFGG
jgi:hypothetical protein